MSESIALGIGVAAGVIGTVAWSYVLLRYYNYVIAKRDLVTPRVPSHG